MLINRIILRINGCDILRPLGIQFKPFANSVHDTKYHKRCTTNTTVTVTTTNPSVKDP